jgi:hypothetical protein
MATEAQIRANRANAQKSTGPKTDEGKAASARNAIKHGMSAAEAVVMPGEEDIYTAFREGILAEHDPQTPTETVLVDNIIAASWTLHRCRMAEIEVFDDSSDATRDPLLCDAADDRMRRIDTYTRRAESSLHRSLRSLQALRKERRALEVAQELAKPRHVEVQWVKPVDEEPPAQTKPIQPAAPPPPRTKRTRSRGRHTARHTSGRSKH